MVELSQSPFALNQMAAITFFSWPLLKCTGGAGCSWTEWGGEEWDHSSLPGHPQSDSALIIVESWLLFIIFEHSKVFVVLTQREVYLKCVWKMISLGERIANQDLVTSKWAWEGARCQKRGCKGASSLQCFKVRSGRARSYKLWELEDLVVPTNVWKSACCKARSKLYDIFLSKAKGVSSKLHLFARISMCVGRSRWGCILWHILDLFCKLNQSNPWGNCFSCRTSESFVQFVFNFGFVNCSGLDVQNYPQQSNTSKSKCPGK